MRTFTVKYIQRPFMKVEDHYKPKKFLRRIDFWSGNEPENLNFHWQNINVKPQDVADFQRLLSAKMVIELPESITIPEGKCLWLYMDSGLYIADAQTPLESDMQMVAMTTKCWNTVPGNKPSEERQYQDILVIRYLMVPFEGYPQKEGELRAMTIVTTTLTEEIDNNYRFGPKQQYVHHREEKWKQWLAQGRIIELSKPLIHNPGPWDVKGKDNGLSFWTDSTKTHHYGPVPKEAKCYFYTHLLLRGAKPQEGEIVRSQAYYGMYYLLDIDLTVYSGYPPNEDQFHESAEAMAVMERENKVVKLPNPYRIPPNKQLWISAQGNIYMAHSQKPNEHPYELVMNAPIIATLPCDRTSLIMYHDFAVTA